MRNFIFSAAAMSIALVSSMHDARAEADNLRKIVRMHMDFGGDTVSPAGLQFRNGDAIELKAGQLSTFAAGVLYQPTDKNFSVEGTLGYKFDQVNGTNGSAKMTRLPLDVLVNYMRGGNRFGGGITYHLNSKFTCDVCSGADIKFDNALGFLMQYAYGLQLTKSGILDVGLRYTAISYKATTYTAKGNSVGFFFGAVF